MSFQERKVWHIGFLESRSASFKCVWACVSRALIANPNIGLGKGLTVAEIQMAVGLKQAGGIGLCSCLRLATLSCLKHFQLWLVHSPQVISLTLTSPAIPLKKKHTHRSHWASKTLTHTDRGQATVLTHGHSQRVYYGNPWQVIQKALCLPEPLCTRNTEDSKVEACVT